jgi:hypothetical protein
MSNFLSPIGGSWLLYGTSKKIRAGGSYEP